MCRIHGSGKAFAAGVLAIAGAKPTAAAIFPFKITVFQQNPKRGGRLTSSPQYIDIGSAKIIVANQQQPGR